MREGIKRARGRKAGLEASLRGMGLDPFGGSVGSSGMAMVAFAITYDEQLNIRRIESRIRVSGARVRVVVVREVSLPMPKHGRGRGMAKAYAYDPDKRYSDSQLRQIA